MNVLVIAAHPDDEVLGVAGTIARHADAGDKVHVLFLAEGATARDDDRAAPDREGEIATLKDAARTTATILGAEPPRFSGLPDNRLDGMALLDVIKIVESIVDEIKPRVVYTHHSGDLNVDHQIAHRATLTACRPLPDSPVRAVYAFETLSSTEWAFARSDNGFHPKHFVDITLQLERKLQALGSYENEIRAFPHPRSHEAVEALARLRGSTVGVGAAEAFEVVRELRD